MRTYLIVRRHTTFVDLAWRFVDGSSPQKKDRGENLAAVQWEDSNSTLAGA
jgi:hypothetical protein